MLKYLIEKEFKQIFRNSFIPKILVVLPLMVILVFPWAANQEITNIQVDIVDRDHSTYSHRLTEKIAASTYFQLVASSKTHEEALDNVEAGKVDVILEIPPHFEKELVTQGKVRVMISANAVNMMKGGIGSGYMNQIIQDFANGVQGERYEVQDPSPSTLHLSPLTLSPLNRFNPFLDYKIFMIPALLVMLLTIICGFLPTLNIVSEKEIGTIEQINVTPVKKVYFILAKLIPNWIFGLVIMTVYLSLAALIYGLTPAGNILTVYFFAILYILVVSGLGLVISNYSSTMQQAMFLMFFFLMVMILLSGLFTPIASMPQWAQHVTLFNPLRYFIEIMRMVYLKGSSIGQLGNQFFALMSFALAFNCLAVISYRKNN
ncbi:MAG: ABC transporter permease [Candidatus Symbiothrix sp.]|jgi:ABC-2 type transport system permease protein|nr:ABC transporter permease [Candidatus Symbiothrix sp.]